MATAYAVAPSRPRVPLFGTSTTAMGVMPRNEGSASFGSITPGGTRTDATPPTPPPHVSPYPVFDVVEPNEAAGTATRALFDQSSREGSVRSQTTTTAGASSPPVLRARSVSWSPAAAPAAAAGGAVPPLAPSTTTAVPTRRAGGGDDSPIPIRVVPALSSSPSALARLAAGRDSMSVSSRTTPTTEQQQSRDRRSLSQRSAAEGGSASAGVGLATPPPSSSSLYRAGLVPLGRGGSPAAASGGRQTPTTQTASSGVITAMVMRSRADVERALERGTVARQQDDIHFLQHRLQEAYRELAGVRSSSSSSSQQQQQQQQQARARKVASNADDAAPLHWESPAAVVAAPPQQQQPPHSAAAGVTRQPLHADTAHRGGDGPAVTLYVYSSWGDREAQRILTSANARSAMPAACFSCNTLTAEGDVGDSASTAGGAAGWRGVVRFCDVCGMDLLGFAP